MADRSGMLPIGRSRFAGAAIALAIVGASIVTAQTQALALTRPVHALVTMLSTPGDSIGAGTPRFFSSPGNATITSYGGIYGIAIDVSGGTSGDYFTLTFAAPRGRTLSPGLYTDAQRTPFRTGTHPGIDVYGSGRGCNRDSGAFDILSMNHGPKGLVSLAMTFVQHCEEGTESLFGEIRSGSAATQPVVTSASKVWWPDVMLAQTGVTLPIWVQNNGPAAASVGTSSVSGTGAADFPLILDNCSGHILAPGGLCQVYVQFEPAVPGPREARLSIPIGPTVRAVSLAGSDLGGRTFLNVQSDPGDYIGGGGTYAYDPSNASFAFDGTLSDMHFGVNGGSFGFGGAFSPPPGEIFTVKTFTGAQRYGYSGSAPGMDVDSTGRGCSAITGSFTINAIGSDPSTGALKYVSLDFTQHCDGAVPALHGQFSYRVPGGDTTPPGPVTHLTVMRQGQSVRARWTNPSDGDLSFVIVRNRPGSRIVGDPDAGRFTYAGTGTSAAVTGYPGGDPFTLEVWTVDTSGNVGVPVVYKAG